MADSPAFELACSSIEEGTDLDRLEARGTVRLALKAAGFVASSVTGHELSVVAKNVLPAELESRGIADASGICQRLAVSLAGVQDVKTADSPEAVFARLGG